MSHLKINLQKKVTGKKIMLWETDVIGLLGRSLKIREAYLSVKYIGERLWKWWKLHHLRQASFS